MKVLKALFIFILVIIIVGGIGYIALSMYYGPNNIAGIFPWNANKGTDTTDPNTQGGMNMPGDGSMTPSTGTDTQNNKLTFSAISLQNRERLMEVQSMVNQAIELITMDPYSRVTIPSSMSNSMQTPQTQSGTGTINIYPNGSNSLNITPPTTGGGAATKGTADTTMPNMPTMPNTGNMNGSSNYVYDQGKLEQLHRGIVRLAQGTMYLTQLNDDMTLQASTIETNNNNYQTYIDRYGTIIKNKAKLSKALTSINQATELVNINPYGGANGYQYNAQYMDQMHRGIFTLAQAMVLANDLSEDLTTQMAQAVTSAQNAIYNNGMGNMPGMNNASGWSNLFNPTSISTVFNIILIIMVVLLIISVFGALGHILKGGNKNNKDAKTKNDTNI